MMVHRATSVLPDSVNDWVRWSCLARIFLGRVSVPIKDNRIAFGSPVKPSPPRESAAAELLASTLTDSSVALNRRTFVSSLKD